MRAFITIVVLACTAFTAGAADAPTSVQRKAILFFGDSLTAGYGLAPEQSYPALVQNKIDAAKLPFNVVNAGLSGDTTSAAVGRLRWVMRQKVDLVVLALGSNDGLRGIPPETTAKNLQTMIDFVRSKDPGIRIVLAGMKMPPNYGATYTRQFAEVFPTLAKKNKTPLIPFLLEGVGGVPELNLPDRVHPTAKGHTRIAETVWKVLSPILKAMARA